MSALEVQNFMFFRGFVVLFTFYRLKVWGVPFDAVVEGLLRLSNFATVVTWQLFSFFFLFIYLL